MPTPQEELKEVEARLNSNLEKVQAIQGKIKKLQAEGQALTQPILEDQGALKVLKKLTNASTT
tara:strand:- start:807 stop:995 length:189 start_codon:yes stop_codon:yes gene_type:complete